MKTSEQIAREWDALVAEFMAVPNLLGLADHGDYLEAALLHSHYSYLERGEALVVKLGVPIRGTGRFSRKTFYAGKTLCDFMGWLRVEDRPAYLDVLLEGATEEECREEARKLSAAIPGRAYVHNEHMVLTPFGPDYRVVPLALDAKRRDVSGSRGWRWACSDIPLHQRLALQMVEGWLGGMGFLLVSLEQDGYLLNDVRVVRASQLQPRTSVDLRECPKVELGLQGCDWLPTVKELFGEDKAV